MKYMLGVEKPAGALEIKLALSSDAGQAEKGKDGECLVMNL